MTREQAPSGATNPPYSTRCSGSGGANSSVVLQHFEGGGVATPSSAAAGILAAFERAGSIEPSEVSDVLEADLMPNKTPAAAAPSSNGKSDAKSATPP
eukprot:928093-Pyramimonas_sp.AAC.1